MIGDYNVGQSLYTQKIRGFQQQKVKYTENSVHLSLTRTKFECPGFAGIYSKAQTSYHARIAFHRWIKLAEETRISELRTMAKKRRKGINYHCCPVKNLASSPEFVGEIRFREFAKLVI